MAVGVAGIKLSPGTQANQKVPTVVVPVSFRVRVYWFAPPPSEVAEIVAEAVSAALDTEGARIPRNATAPKPSK